MSTVQVTVRDAVDELLQASLAVKVLVRERPQPLLVTVLSAEVTTAVLHVSVAVAVPRAASICARLGLQPRVRVLPLAAMLGPVVFTVQVTVREAVDELLQASVALKVLV